MAASQGRCDWGMHDVIVFWQFQTTKTRLREDSRKGGAFLNSMTPGFIKISDPTRLGIKFAHEINFSAGGAKNFGMVCSV